MFSLNVCWVDMAFLIGESLKPVLLRLFLRWKYTLVLHMCVSWIHDKLIVLYFIWLTFWSHKLRLDPCVRGRQVKYHRKECIVPRQIRYRWKWALNSQRTSSFLHLSGHFSSLGIVFEETWYAGGASPWQCKIVCIYGEIYQISKATQKRLKVIDLIICYILCISFPVDTLSL